MGTTLSRSFEDTSTEFTPSPDFLRHGAASDLGERATQEDAHWALHCSNRPRLGTWRGFYVVCDGHGGSDAAHFASRNLLRFMLMHPSLQDDPATALRESFYKTDMEFLNGVQEGRLAHSGTTALAVAVLEMRLYIAHLGDCRAILCRAERQRIESQGGYIDAEGYLNGDLQVSRAIGDFHYPELKNEDGSGFLIAEPELRELQIESDDEFVVLTSDGALDVLTPGHIIRVARNSLVEHNAPEMAAEAVVKAAKRMGVYDNVTVMVFCFKNAFQRSNGNSQLTLDRNSTSYASLIQALED